MSNFVYVVILCSSQFTDGHCLYVPSVAFESESECKYYIGHSNNDSCKKVPFIKAPTEGEE